MADTVREKIISAMLARSAVIRMANGYNTDCGQNPFRARRRPPANSVVLWPQTEESESGPGRNELVFDIQVETFLDQGDENPSVLIERMLGDQIKCFTGIEDGQPPEKTACGGFARSIRYARSSGVYPDDGDTIVAVTAIFTITYFTVAGDPYRQTPGITRR